MGLMSWLFGKEEEDSPAEPLVLGALLECDYGERQTFLNLETDNININALPQACVEDAKAHVNILPFGRCMKNDDCFFKLAPDEKWINTEPQSARVNGKEIITTKSNLICKATGMTIRPVTSGQDGRFARFLIFVRNMDLKYPGLREILEDPYGSLYLEGKYEAALQFLEDQMKSQDGCIELITLYDSENLEGEYMLAALERLMVDCDVRSFERFMDDLTNTALENDVEGMEGWDKNYLNGDMLKLLRIDCKKTEELIKTSPMHRAMEEHKMFSNWLRESTNALAYTLVIYASARAMENVSDEEVEETQENLLDDTGKFIDNSLENNYQKYVKRNKAAGKPVRERLDWKKASDYWTKDSSVARGNKFNETVKDSDIYPYHEVHLSNGKRLDSYDPISGEIISRKATDLNKISEETYKSYLSEFKDKYSVGTVIRSNKYPELDGLKLEGEYILEIPASNAKLSNIKYYEEIAEKAGVKLRFTEEIQ